MSINSIERHQRLHRIVTQASLNRFIAFFNIPSAAFSTISEYHVSTRSSTSALGPSQPSSNQSFYNGSTTHPIDMSDVHEDLISENPETQPQDTNRLDLLLVPLTTSTARPVQGTQFTRLRVQQALKAARTDWHQREALAQEAVEKAKRDLEARIAANTTALPTTEKEQISRNRRRPRRYRRSQSQSQTYIPPIPMSGISPSTDMVESTAGGFSGDIQNMRGPHEENWRTRVPASITRIPWYHFHNHIGHAQKNFADQHQVVPPILPAPVVRPVDDPSVQGEPNPSSEIAAWEHWAVWRMVRRELGLTNDEIRFLLDHERNGAVMRWAGTSA